MYGINGYSRSYCRHHGPSGSFPGCDGPERSENQWMVRYVQITFSFDGFLNRFLCTIQTNGYPATLRCDIANDQSAVVIIFLVLQRGKLFEMLNNIADFHGVKLGLFPFFGGKNLSYQKLPL